MDRKALIDVAAGRVKADVVFKNGRIIQVLTGEILTGDIAVKDGFIAAVGKYEGEKVIDLGGRYVSPGFINAHCHVESSMALPEIYCREELRHGVTAVIADPHEIANVSGTAGIDFMLERARNLPLHLYIQAPSCVPATPFEHSGSVLSADDLTPYASKDGVLGLGEMMNFVGTADADGEIIKKLELFKGKIIDGHLPCPEFLGPYAAAGIETDHESVTFEEALAKLRVGIAVLVREGSGSKNLENIIKGVVKHGADTSNMAFCTDDKHLLDIHRDGTIRGHIKRAIELGLSPMAAYRMATLNAARIYGLKDMGAIAPGRRADLVILDDFEKVSVCDVYIGGKSFDEVKKDFFVRDVPENILNSVNLPCLDKKSLNLTLSEQNTVIEMIPNQIITKKVVMSRDDAQKALANGELLKLAVIERHHVTGHIGLGLLKGYGLKNGAIATTVAHDSHNLIVAGDNDRDMLAAASELQRVQGGYALARDGKTISLPLPVGGLMSILEQSELAEEIERLKYAAYDMGADSSFDPFIALSFLALPVLPEVRLTDSGLVDLTK